MSHAALGSTSRSSRTTARTTIRAVAAVATAALLSAGLTTATSSAHATTAARTGPVPTSFAMKGWGYGSSIKGGSVPTRSGPTAFEVIGCTNRAGLVRTNDVASATLPSLGTADTVATRVWTTRSGGAVSSWSRNTIGQVTLSDSPLGSLVLDAVSTTARAFHDARGFHATTSTDLARLRFKPAMGPAQTLRLPRPGRPVEIPGFARVTVDHSHTVESASGARAFGNGLKVDLMATHSTVRVAHAAALIGGDVRTGLFAGQSYAVTGKAGGDVVNLGRNALLKMPCQGTGGAVRQRALAGVDLGGQVVVGAARSSQASAQSAHRAWGWERSQVASLSLGGGHLRIDGIVGKVRVVRKGANLRDLVRSTAGTTVGRMVVNGQVQQPPTQPVVIPGLAKLEPTVVTRLPRGIRVTALRITLLDGSGAVIDLGNAQLQVRRAARPR